MPDKTDSTAAEPKNAKLRGVGRVFQPCYRDKRTGERKRVSVWWIQYNVAGTTHRESSGSRRHADAVAMLRDKVAQVESGRWVAPRADRTTFEELVQLLKTDYSVNARKSAERMERSVSHLTDYFAANLARSITPDRVSAYVVARKEDGAANATVNRELAALKRMFRLGERAGKVARVPVITLLREDNARKGFFEPEQFRAVLAHLPSALVPVFEVAYITGWRVTSEVLTRKWSHVDFTGGWLRLEPGETKNGEGRMFPLTPQLRKVLLDQRATTTEVEREQSRIIPLLFHRSGKPIRNFRGAWASACKAAGCPGRIPHDFRRTAVRNLERAGVPRSSAMKMVGHRTEAIYRRYAITDEAMLKEGAAKLAILHDAQQLASAATTERTGTDEGSGK